MNLRQFWDEKFSSLKHRDFRWFMFGQAISLTGAWMQNVAFIWVVYDITRSASGMSITRAASFAPILFLSLLGGAAADRFDRRKALMCSQVGLMLVALAYVALIATHHANLWALTLVAVSGGVVLSFDIPLQSSMVPDLVGQEDVVNAVSLNSALNNVTKLVGAAAAGIAIAKWGVISCFLLNALSFLAVLFALKKMGNGKVSTKPAPHIDLHPNAIVAEFGKLKISVREGFQAVKENRLIRNTLFLIMIAGFFGWQFWFLLPVFVDKVLHAKEQLYGTAVSCYAVGALIAGLFLAGKWKIPTLRRALGIASIVCALGEMVFAISRSVPMFIVASFIMGFLLVAQMNLAASLLQLAAPNEKRGRVMSLYSMASSGASPIGSLLIAVIADRVGAPITVIICAVVCLIAAVWFSRST